MFKAPAQISTARLTLRRPMPSDAGDVFAWAGDAEVTRLMGWPTHRSIDATLNYMTFAIDEWRAQGVGTYLLVHDERVIGSTGLHVVNNHRASTGYVLRRDVWGRGFATEACRAMIELGKSLGIARIEAHCHTEHTTSARVLEKSGMEFEGVLRRYLVFPNLWPEPLDVRSYSMSN